MDEVWVIRDNWNRVMEEDDGLAYLTRSIARYMAIAREARANCREGVAPSFNCYQVGVRVRLARELNHKLLAVLRHRKQIGYQAALF